MTRRLFIVGALAAGEYPQRLVVGREPPRATTYGGQVRRERWVFPKTPAGGALEGLAFAASRGRVVEFRAPFEGTACIAREVTDEGAVERIERAERAVADAERALREARNALQGTLAVEAARAKPARVP